MSQTTWRQVAIEERRVAQKAAARSRFLHWVLGVAGAILLLAALFYVAGGLYFAGQIDSASLLASERIASTQTHSYTVPVVAVGTSGDTETLTLRVTPGVPEVTTDGIWGVRAPDGGYGQIVRIVARGSGTVTWEFGQMPGPALRAGEKLEIDHDSFPANPRVALGIPFQDVIYPGPLGKYPAWFVPGTDPDWAILVHGNSLQMTNDLEPMGALFRAGVPMLAISNRNDPGAPSAADGRLRYGLTEYRDLEAAVRYALGHGAKHVILVGRSMGGGIVASFLEHSNLASRVSGVILDAPMLSFSRTIDYAATQRSLPLVGLPIPQSLVASAKWIAGVRYGVDWSGTDYLAGDSKLTAPILLFQGTADKTVPQATSDQLARDRPDLVTYIVTTGAGHLDSWNLNQARYESAIESFVAAHASS